MDRTEFLQILHEVFEAESGTITPDHVLQQIPGWDSLTFLGLIATVDERYGVALAPQQVLACRRVDDLLRMLERCLLSKAA